MTLVVVRDIRLNETLGGGVELADINTAYQESRTHYLRTAVKSLGGCPRTESDQNIIGSFLI